MNALRERLKMRIVKLADSKNSFYHLWPVLIWTERATGYTLLFTVFSWALVIIDIDLPRSENNANESGG